MVRDIEPRAVRRGKPLDDFRPPKRSFPSPRISMGLAAPRQTDRCLLHAVTPQVDCLDGRSGAFYSALPFAKPMELQASLPSPWDRVAFASCNVQGSQLSRGVAPIVRLTFVAFQSRQTPSMPTRPRSMLAGHNVHQGSHRKIGPRRARGHSHALATLVCAGQIPHGLDSDFAFPFLSIGLAADGHSLTTVIREEIRLGTPDPMTTENHGRDTVALENGMLAVGVGSDCSFLTIAAWTLSSADSELGRRAESSMAAKGFTAHCALPLCRTLPPLFFSSILRSPADRTPPAQLGCRICGCLARHTIKVRSRGQGFSPPAPRNSCGQSCPAGTEPTSSTSISKKICGGLVAPTSGI